MLRTPVAEALGAASAASEIRIGGWVRTRRDAKGFSFLELNDGSCLGNIQCIVDEGTAAWDKLEGVNTGACVAVTGELVESPGRKGVTTRPVSQNTTINRKRYSSAPYSATSAKRC